MDARRNNMELFMIKNKSLLLFCTCIVLMFSSAILPAKDISSGSAEQSLEEARKLCTGISESNKRLAKSAGYDIEKLCSSLDLFELPDGSGLAVTVAKYETPNHTDINKLGIMPDEIVSQEPITYSEIATETDKQYQEALKLVTSKNGVLAKVG